MDRRLPRDEDGLAPDRRMRMAVGTGSGADGGRGDGAGHADNGAVERRVFVHATPRTARARLGLLRDAAQVESLEARPDSRFRVRVTASGFDSEWSWRLEPVAGGTKVIHAATFEPFDRWTGILVRLGRASLASRVEAHLRVLKERAEAAHRSSNPA